MPAPPAWFVRSLPGIGMALTAAYVGYEIFQHVRKQQARQEVRNQEDEELALALQMSLNETTEEGSDVRCKWKNGEDGDKEMVMEDRSQLCAWMGLPSDDALDHIPQHRLALCLEVLSYVPVPLRPVFVTTVFGSKLTADEQVHQVLRLLESMDDSNRNNDTEEEEIHIPRQKEEEESGREETGDQAGPFEEENEGDYTDHHSEEFDDEFHEKDDPGEAESRAATTSTATRRSQQKPGRLSSSLACKEQVVVLLTKMSEKDVPVFLQAMELCPRESRGSFLNRLCMQQPRTRINDTAWYKLVEALVRQDEQEKCSSDHEDTSAYLVDPDVTMVADVTTDAFVEILSRLSEEPNSTATTMMTASSHGRNSDYVSGFLRGLFLCPDGNQESIQLLFKLQSLSNERLKQVTLCFSRFSDTQVTQLVQTLLSSPSSLASPGRPG